MFGAIATIALGAAVELLAPLGRFDTRVAYTANAIAHPALTRVVLAITALGASEAFFVISATIAVALIAERRPALLVGWLVATAGTGILNATLKELFRRARPALPDPLHAFTGWSFPSGHAMGTLAIAGMLAYVLGTFHRDQRTRIALVGAAAAWSVLMGATRLYLGAHYVSDVLAGFLGGAAWLAVSVALTEHLRRRWEGSRQPGLSESPGPARPGPASSRKVTTTGA